MGLFLVRVQSFGLGFVLKQYPGLKSSENQLQCRRIYLDLCSQIDERLFNQGIYGTYFHSQERKIT